MHKWVHSRPVNKDVSPAPAPPTDSQSGGDSIFDADSSTRLSARSSSSSGSVVSQSNGQHLVTGDGGQVNTSDVTQLRAEVGCLRVQLAKSEETVRQLQERERLLMARLSEQARQQFDGHGQSKFEDLSLGSGRPSQLISRYGNLFSQARVDASDALDDLDDLNNVADLKGKLLFSVVVLAFRCAQHSLQKLRGSLRATLALPDRVTASSQQLEDALSLYLRKTTEERDLSHSVQEVCLQLWSTLYEYPGLKHCGGLKTYVEECVRLAWALSVQSPPFVIEYDTWQFDDSKFTRFHTSDGDSIYVKSIIWPALLEGEGGPCVFKGIVTT